MLGLDVEIDHRGGTGALTIRYATLEQLDDLCNRLDARPLRVVTEGLLSRTEEGSIVSVVELFARIEAHGRPNPS